MEEPGLVKGSRKLSFSRRYFLRNVTFSAAGVAFGSAITSGSSTALPFLRSPSRVSFVTGTDRREMVYQVLKPFEKEIKKGIRDKQVIIKTNFVYNGSPLCATHPDAVRGLLDFLKPIYKKRIYVAESTASPLGTKKLFEEYGYIPLLKEYKIKFVELNEQSTSTIRILGKRLQPKQIKVIDTFLNPDNYIFSITRLKAHNVVVVTLGLKNMVMGSPLKIYNGINYKSLMHGAGPWWLNYNMYLVAQKVRPQFTVLDGLVGMEGNGPIKGTAVEHGVALAGPDVLAVDRIGAELMGVDIADIGYLNYCAEAGLGKIERSKIKIIGSEKPEDHVIKYKLSENINWQLKWKNEIELKGEG